MRIHSRNSHAQRAYNCFQPTSIILAIQPKRRRPHRHCVTLMVGVTGDPYDRYPRRHLETLRVERTGDPYDRCGGGGGYHPRHHRTRYQTGSETPRRFTTTSLIGDRSAVTDRDGRRGFPLTDPLRPLKLLLTEGRCSILPLACFLGFDVGICQISSQLYGWSMLSLYFYLTVLLRSGCRLKFQKYV